MTESTASPLPESKERVHRPNYYTSRGHTELGREDKGDGCELRPACLTCDLPLCVLDDVTMHRWDSALKPIRDLHAEGIRTREIARRLKIGKRMVLRRLQQVRDIEARAAS